MTVATAMIGVGGIGSVHLHTLAAADRADVVAVCDVSGEAAEAAAERVDATAYTDHESMLAAEADGLDALFVAIPPFAHDGQEALAADHGLDLFVEKPLGLSRGSAERVAAAIDEAGVASQVGHMFRYAPAVERARELIADRDLALVDGHWIGGVPPSSWWGKKERSGGQVVEQASHVFDLVRYFAGEVAEVRAAGGRSVVDDAVDFEDAVSATMRHESGTVSHVATSCAAPDEDVAVRLVGDGVHLELSFDFEGEDPPRSVATLSGTVDGDAVSFEPDGDAWSRELEAFLVAVDDDATPAADPDPTPDGDALLRSPYADARRTFELTLAVDDALGTEAPVPAR